VASCSVCEGETRAPVAAGLLAALAAAAAAPPALAYTPAVDAAQAAGVAENAVGVLFTVTFAAFLLRVLRKRASRATGVRLAAQRRAEPAAPEQPVTAANCFLGAALATVFALGLWRLSGTVDDLFAQAPPSGTRAASDARRG
jgi:hypothetical protein